MTRRRLDRITTIIADGYTIPFASQPPPFHRVANGPDLVDHRDAAWEALPKDMTHGAVTISRYVHPPTMP